MAVSPVQSIRIAGANGLSFSYRLITDCAGDFSWLIDLRSCPCVAFVGAPQGFIVLAGLVGGLGGRW